jgi:heme/copper-type cytochrome/quinol oxidase subunit 2
MENLLESYLADMTNHATQLELLRHDLEQTEHLVRAAVIIIFIIIIRIIIIIIFFIIIIIIMLRWRFCWSRTWPT